MPVTCIPNSTQSLRFLQFYHHPFNALSFLMPAPAIQTQAERETDGRFGGVSWIVSCKKIYWSLNQYLQMRSSSEIESMQMWLRCVLRVGDTGVGWPSKKRRRNVETDTQRRRPHDDKGVIHRQANHQQEGGRGKDGFHLESRERAWSCSGTSGLQNSQRIHFWCLKPPRF